MKFHQVSNKVKSKLSHYDTQQLFNNKFKYNIYIDVILRIMFFCECIEIES